jgi:hypothetical protein
MWDIACSKYSVYVLLYSILSFFCSLYWWIESFSRTEEWYHLTSISVTTLQVFSQVYLIVYITTGKPVYSHQVFDVKHHKVDIQIVFQSWSHYLSLVNIRWLICPYLLSLSMWFNRQRNPIGDGIALFFYIWFHSMTLYYCYKINRIFHNRLIIHHNLNLNFIQRKYRHLYNASYHSICIFILITTISIIIASLSSIPWIIGPLTCKNSGCDVTTEEYFKRQWLQLSWSIYTIGWFSFIHVWIQFRFYAIHSSNSKNQNLRLPIDGLVYKPIALECDEDESDEELLEGVHHYSKSYNNSKLSNKFKSDVVKSYTIQAEHLNKVMDDFQIEKVIITRTKPFIGKKWIVMYLILPPIIASILSILKSTKEEVDSAYIGFLLFIALVYEFFSIQYEDVLTPSNYLFRIHHVFAITIIWSFSFIPILNLDFNSYYVYIFILFNVFMVFTQYRTTYLLKLITKQSVESSMKTKGQKSFMKWYVEYSWKEFIENVSDYWK